MKVSDREDVLDWYGKVCHNAYDFDKEIIEYCKMDTRILMESMLRFRYLMMDITGGLCSDNIPIDPFQKLTLSSLCNFIFRSKFLKEENIEI